MKSSAIELHSTAITEVRPRIGFGARISAFVELTKPRITSLIMLTAAAGFCLGSQVGTNYLLLILALFTNSLTSILGLAVVAGYLCAYTPLKTRTSFSTFVGAFPGAMPPVLGWTAARGHLDVTTFILFAILFLWQFPHFLAIAWMYREDYGRAGICMLPVVEPDGRVTGQQIIAYTTMLLPVSLLPSVLGVSGKIYFVSALILGLLFLASGIRTALTKTNKAARELLMASVFYLPLLFGVMVLNR